MKNFILFNPGQSSLNLGDEIIEDSCKKVIKEKFGEQQYISISTHLPISNSYLRYIDNPEFKFVLGSNLLMSNMCGRFRQWDIKIWNRKVLKNTVLLGVGWHQYSRKANLYTKILYNSILSKTHMHSVRDEYTKKMLEAIGIKNVINTGCPTIWGLSKDVCKQIPKGKAKNVVFTLTDYNKDFENDKKLIQILEKNYENVYFWPQGRGDFKYLDDLKVQKNINVITPSLKSYDNMLETQNMDFVGTRLHGGIRAMQKGHRSIIIAIDNRAIEMSRDYNIPILERNNVEDLEDMINSRFETKIQIPEDNIKKWKEQFNKN